MTRRMLRTGVTALAVALFATPLFPLAQSAADRMQVDPLKEKAARIKKMNSEMRVTDAQRKAAAQEYKANVERVKAAKAAARAKGIDVPEIGIRGVPTEQLGRTNIRRAGPPRSTAAELPPGTPPIGPLDTPDYFTTGNWAFSPMLRKFVDTLPGLGAGGANNLGNYLPLGKPDKTTYPGSDYYEISVREYQHQFHSDLPATSVRGYVQTNSGVNPLTLQPEGPDPINWLGPVIVAIKDRPIRIKFKNEKTAGSHMPIPVDESIMGAGRGPRWPDETDMTACNPSPQFVNDAGQPCAVYPQTRSAIHLHGGRTPWISDGTPHQWILPLGDYNDTANPYKRGVSLYDVPDMPAAGLPALGPDETTYYWSNQQSARLMFYHDHAWGITRLNVLMGEAAGLLLTDQVEQDLINEGILPGYGIPLVIQDRTFVNAAIDPLSVPAGQTFIREYDPTWNWGSGVLDAATGIREPKTGDFWLPHVYMTAENPYIAGGVNPFGKWVYGPWFFPPTANLWYPPKPNPYHDPNCSDPDPAVLAFCTTPNQPPVIPGTPLPSVGAETFFDTQTVNGQAFPVLDVEPRTYRFRILQASNDRFSNLNIYKADPTQVPTPITGMPAPATNTEVAMCAIPGLPPNDPQGQICWDQNLFPNWPADGRPMGVPNPANLGPNIIFLGTEGGFISRPVVLTGQPITWVTDLTLFNVGNIDLFNLFLGPAQRADVLIDFSQFAGQELILYNDAPAAVPAWAQIFDFYTGAPDQSDVGAYGRVPPWNENVPGALKEGPQVGYGPNTRTVLKFRVAAGPVAAPYDVNKLMERWMPGITPVGRSSTLGVFEQGQDPIIVGQSAYDGVYTNNPTFPSVWPAWGFSRIEDSNLMFETVSGTIVTFPMEPKAMHDEMGASFDKEYARMSTNLGMQIPVPRTNNANMTPYMYPDPATEIMNGAIEPISPVLGDGTQIWRVSHNGVDMHPIHFHIFDVQLINRVAWDGFIYPPHPTELGWQDTVRIAPLEDTIVAMRPWTPPLPFGVPDSLRPLNPSIPLGSGFGFTNINPVTQQPLVPPTTNIVTSFAWEYVWHCHILSHEENDMMRPIVLNVLSTIPPAFASAPVVTGAVGGNFVTWVDPTPVNYVTQVGFQGGGSSQEIGFYVERSPSTTDPYIRVGTAKANSTSYQDTTSVSGTFYRYRVVAFNQAGETTSAFAQIGTATGPDLTSVSLAVSNPSAPQGIAAATWTKSLTTTASPIFRATTDPTTVQTQTEFQFSLRMGAGVTNVVQPWGTSRNWTMPMDTLGTVAGQEYTVTVEARTSTAGTVRMATLLYTVVVPDAADTVALDPTVASPAFVGTGVSFIATTTGTTANRQYQFLLDGVVVQNWGASTIWTLPTTTAVGTYAVTVNVRTSTGGTDATATVPYDVRNPHATGVTIASKQVSPASAPVDFLATGQGPAPLVTATGGGYFFQFEQSVDGGPFSVVKDWSTSRVYSLPAGTAVGTYVVRVNVRTYAGDLVPDATAQMTFEVRGVTVSFSSIAPASPQNKGTTVTFTALGAGGGAAATYQYQFKLDGAVVQAWGTAASWVTSTMLGGTHTVVVEVSTVATPVTPEATTSTTYTINWPAATGVSFTSIAPASPQLLGTDVTFTALGSGSDPGAPYQYRFTLDGGTPTAWSATSTYLMPGSTPIGLHTVLVEVSTAAAPAAAEASVSAQYTIRDFAPATGVTFQSITPASPQPTGTAATFVAAGSGSTDPSATYKYQFSLDGVVVQAWGPTASYSLPNNLLEGGHTVTVDVTTENVPATVQATTSTTYGLYGPATGVSFFSIAPASPQAYGTAVTFVATASGGGTFAAYKYRFSVNGAVEQNWSGSATYVMPATFLGGIHTVTVDATTEATPATAQATASTSYTLNYPAATACSVSANPASPQLYGTAVTFTATGQPNTLPPSAFKYRFTLNGTMVQNWSTTATFAMTTQGIPGQNTLLVDCTTENVPVTVQRTAQATYTLNTLPATGITASATPNPVAFGSTTLLQAQGIGGAGPYQYRFDVWNGTVWTTVKNWSTVNTWTMPGTYARGTWIVRALVTTGSPAAGAQQRLNVNVVVQ